MTTEFYDDEASPEALILPDVEAPSESLNEGVSDPVEQPQELELEAPGDGEEAPNAGGDNDFRTIIKGGREVRIRRNL